MRVFVLVLIAVLVQATTAFALFKNIDLSPDIRLEETSDVMVCLLKLTSPGPSTEFRVPADIRSALLSEDRKYLLVTSGTDVVGSIRFIEVQTGKLLLKEWYAGPSPTWKDGTVDFEAVLWTGNGFSVREYHRFMNGAASTGSQFIGNYHGSGETRVGALSPKYNISMVERLPEQVRIFRDAHQGPYVSLYELDSKVSQLTIYRFPGVTRASLEELLSLVTEYCRKVVLEEDYRYLASDEFCLAYPILDRATEQRVFSNSEHDKYVLGFLEILGIDKNIVPWLLRGK